MSSGGGDLAVQQYSTAQLHGTPEGFRQQHSHGRSAAAVRSRYSHSIVRQRRDSTLGASSARHKSGASQATAAERRAGQRERGCQCERDKHVEEKGMRWGNRREGETHGPPSRASTATARARGENTERIQREHRENTIPDGPRQTTERIRENTGDHGENTTEYEQTHRRRDPTTARFQSVGWVRRVFSAPVEENTQRTRWSNADPPTAVGHPTAENTSREAETTERIRYTVVRTRPAAAIHQGSPIRRTLRATHTPLTAE
jgi:hypothetical protein